MNEIERYVFDTQGCLIIEDALSEDEVQQLLDGIPRHPDGRIIREAEFKKDGSEIDFGHEELLTWKEPLFRELIDHPKVLPYLENIMGEKVEDPWANPFYLSHVYGMTFEAGNTGPTFHNGGTPFDPVCSYIVKDDKIYSGLTNVTWCLTDVNTDDGGFWYIPGSHKASFPLPEEIMDYTTIPKCVVQPEVKAGSAVIFTEALTHGTRKWTASYPRIALYYKYVPGYMAHLVSDWPQSVVDLLTPNQQSFCIPKKIIW